METPGIHEQASTNLWQQFQNAGDTDEFTRTWLGLQCAQIDHARLGLVVLETEGRFAPRARWPEGQGDPERLAELTERVLSAKSGLVTELEPVNGGGTTYGIGYPLLVDEALKGSVTVEVAAPSEDGLRDAMSTLQWGVGWLELLYRRESNSTDRVVRERLEATVDLFATVVAEPRLDGAAVAFATELASRTDSDRVSIGFARDRRVTVQAVSHTSHFTKRMNMNRAIAAAMEESIVQRSEIRYPQPEEGPVLITRDHAALAALQGVACVMTIPLYDGDDYYGAVTLERADEHRSYSDEETAYSRSVVSLAGPTLEAKRKENRPLAAKAVDAGRVQFDRLKGEGYSGRKLLVGGLIILALFLGFAKGDYRLSSDVVLEGAVMRSMVAPFDGYVRNAAVRAGDLVETDDVMCQLDDRDLRLERLRLLGQKSQLDRQLQESLAEHDRVNVKIVSAQLDQTRAQADLVEAQLARTQLRAPFDGLVVSGDLSQRLGGAVQQGEVLFEVTPLDAYRVVLSVDERRIADVAIGQTGELVLTSLPDETFPFTVEKITPIATAAEGKNTFRVEARLDESAPRLRPGMEGIGKIDVDRRLLISIWTRDLVEWLKLASWRYLP